MKIPKIGKIDVKTKQTLDKFALVTAQLITLIEQGVKPWTKPWYSNPYQNLLTGHQYQGINPILCTISMLLYDYQEPFFVGFAQAIQQGWKIRQGSKSTWIRWGGTNLKETEDPETGEVKQKFRRAFKWMNIFNIACLDDSNSDSKISDCLEALRLTANSNPETKDQTVEEFIQHHNPTTQFGGPLECRPREGRVWIPLGNAVAISAGHLSRTEGLARAQCGG